MTTKSKKDVEKLEQTLNKSSLVDNAEQLELLIERVQKAQKIYSTFTQEQVDKIFKAAATAADKARIPLAKMAVKETGMGVLEDKIMKNHFAAEYIYNKHKNTKTCGIISNDKEIWKKAEKLHLKDRVLTIDEALIKFKKEEKAVVQTPVFIKKEYLYKLDLNDEFFESLKNLPYLRLPILYAMS